eukprot:scaffold26081_cov40-Phaeocystis_antarctica.AAC.1
MCAGALLLANVMRGRMRALCTEALRSWYDARRRYARGTVPLCIQSYLPLTTYCSPRTAHYDHYLLLGTMLGLGVGLRARVRSSA